MYTLKAPLNAICARYGASGNGGFQACEDLNYQSLLRAPLFLKSVGKGLPTRLIGQEPFATLDEYPR